MSVNPISFQTSAKKLPNLEQLRWSMPEPVRAHRGIFSKDRDYILYSKSFLRLRGKTHSVQRLIRTRLTHTLEVNLIDEDFQRAKTNEMKVGDEAILYRCIVDYIGGMTDRYAYNEYDRLYGTKY